MRTKKNLTPVEESLLEKLNIYRSNILPELRSWTCISAIVGLTRQACEASYSQETDIDRDSVILIALSLEMTLDDLNYYLAFNGYCGLRVYIPRDQVIIEAFNNKEFDYDSLNEKLIDAKEKPFSNYKRQML